jgi:hypothetical protein
VRRFLYPQDRHGEHTASTPSFAIRRAYKAAAAARLPGVNQARIQGMLAAEPLVAPMLAHQPAATAAVSRRASTAGVVPAINTQYPQKGPALRFEAQAMQSGAQQLACRSGHSFARASSSVQSIITFVSSPSI